MPTYAPKSQPKVLPPEGTHIARVVGFIYIGTVPVEWQGEKKMQTKIRLTWELPTEKREFKEGEGEKPFVISEEYTLSLGDKSKFYPIVKGIVGNIPDDEKEKFDVEDLVGKVSLISIEHEVSKSGAEYARVVSTAPLMKGQTAPEQINEYKILNYEDKWNKEYFDSLPQFVREKMESSQEYKKKMGVKEDYPTEETDSIPF